MFQKVILESRDQVKTYCDLQKQLGSSSFQDRCARQTPQTHPHQRLLVSP
jgi:hypothetical protein